MLYIPKLGQQSDSMRGAIYRKLYRSGPRTKQELTKDCEISMPTLNQHLNALIAEGFVDYAGENESTGGRRARSLSVVPDARVAVGILLMEEITGIIAIDLQLNELVYQELPFAFFGMEAGRVAELSELLERFLDEQKIDRERLLGVGICVPGMVSPGCEEICLSPNPRLNGQSLAALTNTLPYRVYIEHDASCAGHAEWFALGQPKGSMAYLALDSGIGGCFLIDGIPYSGNDRRGAAFGHICVQPGGLLCSCGKRGCLEAHCSPRRIQEEAGVPLDIFFQGVQEHRLSYELLWFDMLRHLAVGINNIRLIIDCDVVLGGLLSEYLKPWFPVLNGYVEESNPFDRNAGFLRLSTLQRHVAPRGAALYFIREFIDLFE